MESWKCGGCGKWFNMSIDSCGCQDVKYENFWANGKTIITQDHNNIVRVEKEPIVDFHFQYTQIGNQIWTTENFDGTELKDGSTIPVVIDRNLWSNLKTPAMCYYDNDKSKGTLYNWYAVKELKVPSGWRVATDKDWIVLTDYINDKNIPIKKSGLNLNYGGYRIENGSFGLFDVYGNWWCGDDQYDYLDRALFRSITRDFRPLYRDYCNKIFGLSVRLMNE